MLKCFIIVCLPLAFLFATAKNYKKCPFLFDQELPFITHHPAGELGNQLYQAAVGVSLAIDHHCAYFLPPKTYQNYNEVFWRFVVPSKKLKVDHYFNESGDFQFRPIIYEKNMKIGGYFLSYKYFHHNKDVICSLFAPSEKIENELLLKYKVLLEEKNVVGLHIRTLLRSSGDAGKDVRDHKKFFQKVPAPNMHYILKAIECFPENSLFIVCSDKIAWAKKALKKIPRRFYFVEDKMINEFYLLTLCDHCIISNSTFAWWAAYLNKNPNKIIVAPLPFDFYLPHTGSMSYPPEWVLIERLEDGLIPVLEGDEPFIMP